MTFTELAPFAAWRHRDARDGFEVVFLHSGPDEHRMNGHACAVEDGSAWAMEYRIVVGGDWTTRSAHVIASYGTERRELRLTADGAGGWLRDGEPAALLRGCLDVDLEFSVMTNALPVHRLRLGVGHSADVPAAYVRIADLEVERLDQRYVRTADDAGQQRYAYSAPRFGYTGTLAYDESGLLLDYPGIAERTA